MNVDYSNDYASHTITSEKVLAHQIENIYLSEAKRPLTLDYVSEERNKKGKL